ncbi:protein of unknown function [Citrobacter freundii]|nr:protein of unknown function [Citrobacter freundii]
MVTIGPTTIAANTTTKINAGYILKNLDIKKCRVLLFVIKLFVTNNPLIKKNIFTATEPMFVNGRSVSNGSFNPLELERR